MKKFVSLLAITLIALHLSAQLKNEVFYNSPKPGEMPINVEFRLGNGIKMTLELNNFSQLDTLGKVDVLLHKVWTDILPIKDSFTKSFVSNRIDYNNSLNHGRFRILHHIPNGISYIYENGSLIQNKTEEDTLRIRFETFNEIIRDSIRLYHPFYVTLTLNRIEEITNIKDGVFDSAIAMLKNDKKFGMPIKANKNMFSNYNVVSDKWSNLSNSTGNKKSKAFEPDIYVGFQYTRGYWVPSAALGFQFIYGVYDGKRDVFKLLWEPHFLFTRNSSNSLKTERNDFITFRYYHYDKTPDPNYYFPMSFSFGYLIGRKGYLFEKNTFKFSVPGITYKYLSLEPEFYFNDFFKHFSPSLKLNFNID